MLDNKSKFADGYAYRSQSNVQNQSLELFYMNNYMSRLEKKAGRG